MAAIGQTIAVVDKSGKLVSTSKHLVNVFKEAKAAYRERKAEIVAGRQSELEERRARKALRSLAIDDDQVSRSSKQSSRSKHASRRPAVERYRSDSVLSAATHSKQPPSPLRIAQERDSTATSPIQMTRRHTAQDSDLVSPRSPLMRSNTSPCEFDMDLAYGEMPPSLEVAKAGNDGEVNELKGLVGKVKLMLEEADCLQYSATAIIASLQKNPDAMAAVALTLAEISNLASKLAPGALMAMKGSAPAVFALLASPQFLVAAGVGVGVTIVALGGYKVIKKIKARHAEDDPGVDELLELGQDGRIDSWRRGVVEAEIQSEGTSVDGEFITPQAAALSRLNLDEGMDGGSQHEPRHRRSAHRSRTSKSSRDGDSRGTKAKKEKKEKRGSKEKREKKPSQLRLMFQ
ncbi:MAG: hypothetical protein Q9190_005748 [Brigantiaea leucoxantha]